jgi:hypothetical protein
LAAYPKVITPSLADKLVPPCNKLTLLAGEDIAAGDPMYIKTDGLWWRSNGTAATAAAKVHGWATLPAKAGSPVTGHWNVHLSYGPNTAVLGSTLFVSATLGQLDTAATTGGTGAVATVDYISNDGGTPHAVLFVIRSTY